MDNVASRIETLEFGIWQARTTSAQASRINRGSDTPLAVGLVDTQTILLGLCSTEANVKEIARLQQFSPEDRAKENARISAEDAARYYASNW